MSLFSKLLGKGGVWGKAREGSQAKPDDQAPPEDPIDAFWAWWRLGSVQLADAYDGGQGPSDALIEEISEHVSAMDEGLAWETGPGHSSDHHFALSPEGDARLRVLTQRWLSRAPKPSKSWEYYPARQPSAADPRQTLRIGEREFGLADFRLTLEADKHRAVVDVVVFHALFADMQDDERLLPTFLFLDNLLGEDGVTSWIGSIDAVGEVPAASAAPSALVEAVGKLRDEWDDEAVTLVEGKKGGLPIIAAVRLGLKRLDYLLHDHHLQLTLKIARPSDAGLPAAEEVEELNDLEDGLVELLDHRVVWIGHETCDGERVVHLHADSSPTLQDEILQFCQTHGDWQAELAVQHDPSWKVLDRY